MARIIAEDEKLIPGELYVTIRTADSQRFTIVHANMDATVYSLKLAISDWMQAYPEDLDIVALYPIADKTFLHTIHPDHRHLMVIANVPIERVPSRYLTSTSEKRALNLVHLSAEHIPMMESWLSCNLFEQLELGCDHPRIDEILVRLGEIILHPTSLKTIHFRRSFSDHHLPMLHMDVLYVFYQIAQLHNIIVVLDPHIFGNQEVVEFGALLTQPTPISA
jgi:hypothetical protein